jgi:putative heme transporter
MSDPLIIPPSNDSPLWGRNIKTIVVVVTLLLFALITWRFQSLLAQLVMAAIIAYILNPIIVIVNRRTTLKRQSVILLIYLLLAVAIIWALIALGVAAFQQIGALIDLAPNLLADIVRTIQAMTSRTEPINIWGFELDPSRIPWDSISSQVLGMAEPLVSRGGSFVRQLTTTTVRWLGNLLFVFVLSIYIANEIPKLGGYIGDFAQQPGYRKDAERLMREFGRIWSAYLRGQVVLGLIIGFAVWVGLSILGVQNALALGLLSGLLEFIPILGPVIGAGAAITVAFFQPGNYLGLESWQFALVVLGLMLIIQQLENNVLVPRIVGEALDLHPLLVIVGVFMGGSLAGILGAILAAPVLATFKLLGIYAWRKMFDMPPFPLPEPETTPTTVPLMERVRLWLARLETIRPKRP